MKKLKISKRTISSLTGNQMVSIKGGATLYGCATTLQNTCGCPPSSPTCASKYPACSATSCATYCPPC